MDGESSLYMCPCYKLFQSLEEVLVHQLTCQTANNAIAPPPAQAEAAELYANAPAGQSLPAGPVQAGPDPHHQALDSLSAIVPDQAPGQRRPPVLPPGSAAAVDAAKLNGLLLGTRPPPRRALPRQASQAGLSSTPATAPLIRYQCGECGLLFESLPLWQRHNKLGQCGQEARKGPVTEEKPAEGERECEKKEVEKEKSESVHMAEPEPPMKIERMEEGDEEKVEVSQCSEKLATFDHSYQGIEAGGEGSSKDEVPSSSKHGSESSPSTSAETHVSSPSEEMSLDRTFLCVCCGAALGSLEALASHRKARHGLEGALHCCQVCGKEFMNTTLFLYHQRQHRQQGPAQSTEASPARAGLVSQKSTPQMKSEAVGEGAVRTTETVTDSAVVHPHPIGPVFTLSASVEPCPHCGQTFKRRCHLRAHLQSHSGHKPHRCDLCPKVFAYKSNLGRHRHTHSGTADAGSDERPHVCERCGRGFAHAGSLKQHALLHERQDARQQAQPGQEGAPRPYACADCPASFRTQAQLQVHSYKHTGNYPFSCSVCGQSFLRKKRLELHSLIHQGKQPVPCPRCPELFLGQSELDAHLPICPRKTHPAGTAGAEEDEATGRRVRRRRRGQLTCDLCGHRCVTQQGLDLHRLAHAGLTPLRCPRPPCRQRFATEAALQEHLLVHDASSADAEDETSANNASPAVKPRPYHCKDCGKDFTTASSLSVHLRIHTGERPFQCPQCGKRFRQIPHLRDHERLHSDERPFVCSVCGRSFVLAARLAEHARTHSGDKPYSCPLCPRTFRSLSNLGKHRKTHARPPPPAAASTLPSKLAHRLGTTSGGVVAVPQGETQALVLPAMGEGQAAVHTILLLHAQPGSAPAFATLPLGESALSGAPSSSLSPALSSPSPSPSAPLVLMHPSVALGDGHPGQLGPVVSHAIEVIVTETGE
ncbi:zinc finger protein 665-like isoform X1 [Alosa sapidissima]|uniref:zinc finger protein 665-like isoform X1 n=1 Tax=Alosa sapidissima TaxID=34773 RepID=UPI001C091BF2|nr:zinc finger protein 665-like isoform X1 [Alosa sapidissima]XP_041933367.1 zinc finger protein 665-like isoform X1 [Alosa sapidissima]XP_041933369.1 zinc finger protein 665-like isoform X1 [Alosa sapidissima]